MPSSDYRQASCGRQPILCHGPATGRPPRVNLILYLGVLAPRAAWRAAIAAAMLLMLTARRPSCFLSSRSGGVPQLQPAGTLGTSGRGAFRGPDLRTVDFAAVKAARLRNEARIELRLEVFNLFNRSNFGNPTLIAFAGAADNERPCRRSDAFAPP